MKLLTERLFLREYETSDYERVHIYGSQPQFSRYEEWGPNSPEDTTLFIASKVAESIQANRHVFDLAVCLKDQNLMIGGCGIRRETESSSVGNLGWAINPEFQNHGYATYNKTLNSLDRELQQTKEVFITEHYKKYHTDTRRPPAWKTLEVVSFGVISKFYGNLKSTIASKDAISFELGTVNHTFLPSWLQSIAQIRNICAHHGRLWNKNLPGRPKLLPKPPMPWVSDVPKPNEHFMLYVHLCCMKYLMNTINPGNSFTQKLQDLLAKYPNIDPNALGMKLNWFNEPLWKQSK